MASQAAVPGAGERTAPSRLHCLDGLRALAALWVVCNHAWLTIYPTAAGVHGVEALLTGWMVYGHFAVVAFIVISGYSLAIATSRTGHRLERGFGSFLRRRFRRIVLPYWGALLISLGLALTALGHDTGTHWDSALPVTRQGVLLHLSLLQDFATTGQINHAMWSVAIEWHIYFLFPLLLWLRRRLGLLGATGIAVMVCVIISSRFTGGLTLCEEANLFGCFAIGVAAREVVTNPGRLRLVGGRWLPVRWDVLGATLVGAVVADCVVVGPTGAGWQSNTVTEPMVAAATACLLIAVTGSPDHWLGRVLSWRPLTWVGSISYSVYLLHAPVLQLIWQYVLRPLGLPVHQGAGLALLLMLGIPASLTGGWAYYRLIEARCLTSTRPGRG